MLPSVPVPAKTLEDYRASAGDAAVDRLRAAAAPLEGARILHLSATAYGGGVAELLYSQVALFRDLGFDTHWQLIEGTDDFFQVTKMIHNGLQGAEVPWTERMRQIYLDRSRSNAAAFGGGFDYVFVHDPQPAALLSLLRDKGDADGRWIWRCHIDLSTVFDPVWSFLEDHVNGYDAAVFTTKEFVQPGISGPEIAIIPPSIDPLSPKNAPLSEGAVREVLATYDVDPYRPLICQVSRFDPWKDPLGVIDAFRGVRERHPGLQLVMVASMAHDDPEGWHYYEKTEAYRANDPDIYLLSNLQGVGDVQVNAFQRAADVVVQKSIREGFGLVVAEAMWKGRPVVAGDVGGIRLQIEHGRSGYLVDSIESCARRTADLLDDPATRARMGEKGRERVREHFLTLRQLEDYLKLLSRIA